MRFVTALVCSVLTEQQSEQSSRAFSMLLASSPVACSVPGMLPPESIPYTTLCGVFRLSHYPRPNQLSPLSSSVRQFSILLRHHVFS